MAKRLNYHFSLVVKKKKAKPQKAWLRTFLPRLGFHCFINTLPAEIAGDWLQEAAEGTRNQPFSVSHNARAVLSGRTEGELSGHAALPANMNSIIVVLPLPSRCG